MIYSLPANTANIITTATTIHATAHTIHLRHVVVLLLSFVT